MEVTKLRIYLEIASQVLDELNRVERQDNA